MKKVLTFLSALEKNNNKTWFDLHRADYEEAKEDHLAFVDELIQGIVKFDPSIGMPSAKECVFRINRDIRFSNNKAPYKNNMGGMFAAGGKKSAKPCYYIHIQPGATFLAGGLYMPEKDVLAKVRQEIDYEGKKLEAILKKASFRKYFDGLDQDTALVRMPKGFEEGHAYAHFLKLKSFTVTHAFSNAEVLKKDFSKHVVDGFKEMKSLNDYLSVIFEA
jgi:uncharacterized protein (TIGR02453 family)